MNLLEALLTLSTLLSALVAGFLFAFAVVVMPGIKRLSDHDFLQAFKQIDGVIQNNSPLFMIVWIGSALSLATTAILSAIQLQGADRLLILAATILYFASVQLPTIAINIPLNNSLQALQLDQQPPAQLLKFRAQFEPTWNRWNKLRTLTATLTTLLLITATLHPK